jgi:hypothetical protein
MDERLKDKFKHIWKDPVWSKVIADWILRAIKVLVVTIPGYAIATRFFPGLPFANFAAQVINLFSRYIGLLNRYASVPVWLLLLLFVSVIAWMVTLTKKYLSSPQLLTDYFTISEVARELGVSEEQVFRWGTTSRIIFAFVRHEPHDFDEVRFDNDDEGRKVKITREHRTLLSISSHEKPPLEIRYISPEDTTRIILNKVANRSILVSKIFATRDLDPKKGTLLGRPISISKNELVVTRDELLRFQKKQQSGIKARKEKEQKGRVKNLCNQRADGNS